MSNIWQILFLSNFGVKMKYLKIVFIFSIVFSFFSCRDKETIEFKQSDVEALDIEYKWAVVNEPYVACRENPSYEADVVKNLRKGVMEKIVGEKTVKVVIKDEVSYEKWIAFNYGWVPEKSVDIYLNRLRAEKASKSINNGVF